MTDWTEDEITALMAERDAAIARAIARAIAAEDRAIAAIAAHAASEVEEVGIQLVALQARLRLADEKARIEEEKVKP
jgi:predicted ATPase